MTTKKDGRRNNRPSASARQNAGRKRSKATLHIGGVCFIEIDGQLRQYQVVSVTPHLTLRPTSKLAVCMEG